MGFRDKVYSLLTMPVEKVIVRSDKWGEVATVYFYGKAVAWSIDSSSIDDADAVETFLHSVRNGSSLMVEAAEQHFGHRWEDHVRTKIYAKT
jgi:hypothetical protein